jgi:YegS/Rv2252/BmrU family lipid kinase
VTVTLIVNPYANRWRARDAIPKIERALLDAGVRYDLQLTHAPGEAIQKAEAAARAGSEGVLAAGGDGTVHEVVNGLIRAAGDAPTVPLGIVPVGSGNDFSDMAGLPRDFRAMAAMVAKGHTRLVDAARVNDRFFNNNCAVAMEPLVTLENDRMTRLQGQLRYGVALMRALLRLRAWQMEIEWDGGSYEGPIFLFSICNGPRIGSMFRMAPAAAIDDGILDFVMAPEIPKRTVMAILPRLINGSHVDHPAITTGRSTQLHIRSRPATPLHADGEVLSEGVSDLRVRVLPGKLTLLSP